MAEPPWRGSRSTASRGSGGVASAVTPSSVPGSDGVARPAKVELPGSSPVLPGGEPAGVVVGLILVAAVVVGGLRPPDLRGRDDVAPAQAAEVRERGPAAIGIPLEELPHPRRQGRDHVRPDGMVEHRGRGALDGTAAQEEAAPGLADPGAPAEPGELAIREG